MNSACVTIVFFYLVILFPGFFHSQTETDSIGARLPRHYFNTVFQADIYRKPESEFTDTNNRVSRKLKSYGIKQFFASFYTPVLTVTRSDNNVISNIHLLITANFLSLRPVFSGLPLQHHLVRAGVGARYIYNNGRKSVWFADLSPFITRDISNNSKSSYRLASSLIYSHNSSLKFNWRVGIIKSFMWGNRYYLPFLGLRFGRLDRTYVSIQFPRSILVNVPVNHKLLFGAFSRAQGGVFNFSNNDTLYFNRGARTFHFSRYEVISGIRFDFRPSFKFSCYLSAGISSRNDIAFYSDNANPRRQAFSYHTFFYRSKVPATLFAEAGIVLKFGKTRSYYNDKNIYDAIDLNNGPESDNGNVQIPLPVKQSDLNLESVKDLVDYAEY